MAMHHVSSGSFQAWRSPQAIVQALVTEYDCVLDAAADKDNSVCPAFLDGSEGSDGLLQPWDVPNGGVWCNPPYANVAEWLAKAYLEVIIAERCQRAVLLLPASVGVAWFSDICRKAEVQLFDKRLAFDPPPFDQCSVEDQKKLYDKNGKPKSSPGSGNCLVVIENGGLVGITGMRSSVTGRLVQDFLDGQVYSE